MDQETTSNADLGVYDTQKISGDQVAEPLDPVISSTADTEQETTSPFQDTAESITEEQTAQTTSEDVVAEPQSAKDDPNRIAYWQSQADVAKNQANQMLDQLNMYKGIVDKMAMTDQQTGTPAAPQPQAPGQAPTKPNSYNEVDAYNDPESESFRYRVAKEEYNDNRFSFMLDRMDKQEAERQQQVQQQQERMVANQAYTHVKNGLGWDDGKASSFVQWAQNPENVTLDVLAKIYELNNAPNPASIQAQNTSNEMRQAGERLQVPRTTAVTSGQAEPEVSDQDMFNAGLLANSRVRR